MLYIPCMIAWRRCPRFYFLPSPWQQGLSLLRRRFSDKLPCVDKALFNTTVITMSTASCCTGPRIWGLILDQSSHTRYWNLCLPGDPQPYVGCSPRASTRQPTRPSTRSFTRPSTRPPTRPYNWSSTRPSTWPSTRPSTSGPTQMCLHISKVNIMRVSPPSFCAPGRWRQTIKVNFSDFLIQNRRYIIQKKWWKWMHFLYTNNQQLLH